MTECIAESKLYCVECGHEQGELAGARCEICEGGMVRFGTMPGMTRTEAEAVAYVHGERQARAGVACVASDVYAMRALLEPFGFNDQTQITMAFYRGYAAGGQA